MTLGEDFIAGVFRYMGGRKETREMFRVRVSPICCQKSIVELVLWRSNCTLFFHPFGFIFSYGTFVHGFKLYFSTHAFVYGVLRPRCFGARRVPTLCSLKQELVLHAEMDEVLWRKVEYLLLYLSRAQTWRVTMNEIRRTRSLDL